MNTLTIQDDILFKIARTNEEFSQARELFNEYADSLDTDLCFQNFTNELETIDKQYNEPKGALLLAYKNNIAVGCVGIRELDEDAAELKRMYVQPAFRKYKIGRKLLELAIQTAKELNYKKIKLDTLPSMVQAQNLYHSFGFYEIPSYRFNPVQGTAYMEKKLT
jgi:ribosomal protein S18 acetylase RimI-like enzyme